MGHRGRCHGITAMRRGVVAALAALALCAPLRAEPRPCADAYFTVDAEDAALAARICTLAQDIRQDLGRCGLTQRRSLTIEIVDDVAHPMGICLAYFDCDYDLIRVTHPDLFSRHLEADAAYARLPGDVALRAVLTHELTHALVAQGAGTRQVDIVDQEYIAAAMELELMDPEWRNVFLQSAPVPLPPSEGLIDIWIYGFTPRKFAVNAWQHFRLPENGCPLVQRLVAGEASFAKPVRPELR